MERDERVESLFHSTQQLIRGWKSYFYKALKPENLSPTLMSLLFHIGMNQPVNGRHIGESFHLSPSAVSQLIDGLNGLGYITKETRPQDRRATYYGLTEEGKRKLKDLDAKRKAFLKYASAGLTDDEMDTMIRLQRKLVAGIQQDTDENTIKEDIT